MTRTTLGYLRIALLIGLVGSAAFAKTTETYGTYDETYGDDYQAGDIARITYVENGVTIERGYQDPSGSTGEGALNDPVFPGDTLATNGDQRVELQLADGTLVRLDRASLVRLQALPDPYAEFRDNTVIGLSEGTIQVVADVDGSETFRVDTPGATVYLLGPGDFRIEATADGRTLVASRQGVAEVSGDGGSVLVRAGQRTEAWAGAYPDEAVPFNTLEVDAFDRWTSERDRTWRITEQRTAAAGTVEEQVYEELPEEVQPYYRELSNHGRWVYVEDYGWSWYPVSVAVGWRPYHYGRWAYGPYGYFWCSTEPWGWAPYHYGRWSVVPAYGWVWTPGRVFAGAWVTWSWGSAYVGWCPLNYWNRPVPYGSVHWGSYHAHSWTFVHHQHIGVHDYHRYAVPIDRIGDDLAGRRVSTRPPQRMGREARSDPDARRRAVSRDPSVRPALDRGLVAGRTEGESGRAERFRDIEDRLIRRGARADRVNALAETRTTRSAGSGARTSAPDRRAGTRARRADVNQRSPRDAPVARDVTRADGNSPVRPRQIASDPRRRSDDRVRDLYRRIGRSSAGPRSSSPTVDRAGGGPSRAGSSVRGDGADAPRQRRTAPPAANASPRRAPPSGDARAVRPRREAGSASTPTVRSPVSRSRAQPGRTSAGRSSDRAKPPVQRAAPQQRSESSRSRVVRPAPSRSSAAPTRRSSPSRTRAAPPSQPSRSSPRAAPSRSPAKPKASPSRPGNSRAKAGKKGKR